MYRVESDRLRAIVHAMRGKTIGVLGDFMVDRYVWGNTSRISPEAPVPVVDVTSESARLGGAANVAANLSALGVTVLPFSVIGDDAIGKLLLQLMRGAGFKTDGVSQVVGRPTTVKTRVIAQEQHVVRVDHETKEPISVEDANALLRSITRDLAGADALILEDYNKGVLTPHVIENAIAICRDLKKTVTVDPKYENFFAYRGVTLMKPNRGEAERALGIKIKNERDAEVAATTLKERLDCSNVLLTLGERGVCLLTSTGTFHQIPSHATIARDVSGAGDTVIATATAALAAGANPIEAAIVSNIAAAVVVREVGVVPITSEALLREIDLLLPSNPGSILS
jgi:rfaE bifunctional protein kinase chain/domain